MRYLLMVACECFEEVVGLHRFFQGWFRGQKLSFERLESVLDPEFVIISPDGVERSTEETLNTIRAAHGTQPNLSIEVVARGCRRVRGLHLTTYQEHHAGVSIPTTRISTALLERRSDQWRWRHVHETWNS